MKQFITKNNKQYILTLFERSWGEIDWILPVLYKLKHMNSKNFSIIVIFTLEWKSFNPTITNSALYFELQQIADEIIYLDKHKNNLYWLQEKQVKCILCDGNSTPSKLAVQKAFPFARNIWFPHGVFINLRQEFNKLRRFNLFDDFTENFKQDLWLVDTELGAKYLFDGYPCSKMNIVGTPRFDQWWIDRLLSNKEFLMSEEAKKAALAKRVFLFTTTTPLRELPFEIFDYVITSVADLLLLNSKDNYLIIKPHPRQPHEQIMSKLRQFENGQWTISSLHLIQLATLCDIAISVNSGAIIDILATGKPLIEFAQYIQPTEAMNINPVGHLQSHYISLNLSVPVKTKENLIKILNSFFNNENPSIWKQQQQNFKNFFSLDNNASERAAKLIAELIDSEGNNKINIQRSWSPVINERQIFLEKEINTGVDSLHLKIKRIKALGMPISSLLLSEIANFFKTDIFIATGTFNQIMAHEAAKIFREVHFIESASDLYQPLKFKHLSKYSNIQLYNTSNMLKLLLPNVKGKILFWLESHEGAAITFKSKTNTPIIEELKTIKEFNITNSVFLINNLRHFQPLITDGNEATKVRNYPGIEEALDIILSINNNYSFYVLGDIALAYLSNNPITISQGIRACTCSRLFNGNNIDINMVLEAENYIAFNLSKQEKEAIKALHSDYSFIEEPMTGSHYRLWLGLVFFGEENYAKAEEYFIETIKRGLNHWRIGWYLALSAYKNKNFTLAKDMATSVLKIAPDYEPVKQLLYQLEKEGYS